MQRRFQCYRFARTSFNTKHAKLSGTIKHNPTRVINGQRVVIQSSFNLMASGIKIIQRQADSCQLPLLNLQFITTNELIIHIPRNPRRSSFFLVITLHFGHHHYIFGEGPLRITAGKALECEIRSRVDLTPYDRHLPQLLETFEWTSIFRFFPNQTGPNVLF